MKSVLITAYILAGAFTASAQMPDTTGLYKGWTDSLEVAVSTARQSGTYLSKGKDIRTEVISSAGLQKLACCSLADSFENSASVTVGYSDAVTGARQIRLLGLSGTYTQMLDEARPVMRGLSAPFGLSYIPGPWMESIQIAKGATSVVNGSESITGAINIEHKKPTDEKPLFVNASVMNDTKTDFNIVSSLQMGEKWSTALMGHVSGNFMAMDGNGDGFADDPRQLQFNLANRWLYFKGDGTAVRFGVRAVNDSRQGGQLMHGSEMPGAWTSDIANRSFGAYLKAGTPAGRVGSVAMVSDYSFQKMDSRFGDALYGARQHSAYLGLLYQDEINERNKFTIGASGIADWYDEDLSRFSGAFSGKSFLASAGPYAEYTFHNGETFSAILGLRADAYTGAGIRMTPRLTLKYSPSGHFTFRANGGRGLRFSTPVSDNIGILSTGKTVIGDLSKHTLEDAWTAGGNATWYIGGSSSNYLSLDFFHSEFTEQQIIDFTDSEVLLYKLSSVTGGRSYTDNIQADLALEPLERFTVNTTFRYTLAKASYEGKGLMDRPMISRYKAVLNLQYATRLSRWIFDGTVSLNGPCTVYDFMRDLRSTDGELLYASGKTPVYPLLYLQVTRRMKGWDIYIGGENLGGFRQKDVIISAPGKSSFDASQVWGPIMGAKIYAGIRFTIWKTY